MKLTELAIHEAHLRAVHGESVRSIARSMAVTEGALRFHFCKGPHPREVRRIAFQLYEARFLMGQVVAAMGEMTPAMQAKAKRMAQSAGTELQWL